MDPVLLRPYSVSDCETLVDTCLHDYAAHSLAASTETNDTWRRKEWPFCSREAACMQAISLSVQSISESLPCAWSILLPPSTVIGMIAVTHVEPDGRFGLLGTYISPPWRGLGLQKKAKETLFPLIMEQIDTLYCIIAANNTPSLQAMRKVATTHPATQIAAAKLPPTLYYEWSLSGSSALVFQITLFHSSPGHPSL